MMPSPTPHRGIPPPRRPVDHQLLDAAEARVRRCRGPGVRITTIILISSDGCREEIHFTAELRALARQTRDAGPDENDLPPLTGMERTVLEALCEAAEPLTGDEVAAAAGYEPGGHVRRVLSALVQKRLVTKQGGYVATARGRKTIAGG